jgi:nitronate monooxygenase
MWPDRRLCDRLCIQHPIIQAPMAGSATPALAVAVSNAGGLGSLGCADNTADEVRELVAAVRAGTNRPFNLNFFAHAVPRTPPEVLARMRERLAPFAETLGVELPASLPELPAGFDDRTLDLVLELRPPVVSFHLGMPEAVAIKALKVEGIILLATATTVAEARWVEAAGIDVVVAQGYEAGGHRGSHQPSAPTDGIGTMALVPQVVDAVAVPVVAAGGIGDARGMVAAMALGAAGVQLGTTFLGSPEAATEPARRAAIRAATDGDTMVTNAISGRAARARRSRYALEMAQLSEPVPAFPQLYALTSPLRAADAARGSGDITFQPYGQAAALSRELPAADLVARLVAETAAVLERLARPPA